MSGRDLTCFLVRALCDPLGWFQLVGELERSQAAYQKYEQLEKRACQSFCLTLAARISQGTTLNRLMRGSAAPTALQITN